MERRYPTHEELTNNRRVYLEALKSGRYKQCAGQLRDNDKFCLLGVAVDLFGEGHWFGNGYQADEYRTTKYPDYRSVLKLGLTRDDQDYMVKLNDTDRYRFEEIADILSDRWSHDTTTSDLSRSH